MARSIAQQRIYASLPLVASPKLLPSVATSGSRETLVSIVGRIYYLGAGSFFEKV